ncbi:MAG: hypothetical protein RIC80_15375 [Cyclobacteriaceae bacterium]
MNHNKNNRDDREEKDAESFVNEVMSSLDHIEMVNPSPFFYTRVKSRLDRSIETVSEVGWLTAFFQSRWAMGSIALLMLINLSVVLYSYDLEDIPVGQTAKMEVLIDEYQLEYTSMYSYIEE